MYLDKPGILHGFFQVATEKSPFSPLSLPPSYLLTVAAVGNISADLTRRPIHTHTPFQKYNPILTLAACLPARSHARVLPPWDWRTCNFFPLLFTLNTWLFSNRLLSLMEEITQISMWCHCLAWMVSLIKNIGTSIIFLGFTIRKLQPAVWSWGCNNCTWYFAPKLTQIRPQTRIWWDSIPCSW